MSANIGGREILEECIRLRRHYIEDIARRYRYQHQVCLTDESQVQNDLDVEESQINYQSYDGSNTQFPFVLLLGNHSSGKSSFINYLLGKKVQSTGVAPTDDSFTVIVPSNLVNGGDESTADDSSFNVDRNGPALVGDPDLGFSGLQRFGDVLVNHTMLKIRSGTKVKDFCLVDSPGMIDSPTDHANKQVNYDRGYDFAGVCRWYAERADVILVFFDPDKPGTTGETLSILTSSLVGLDHKLHLLLNKADQFVKIHDFARAYGSLCWNLSKVIPRKDLPRIHTTCLPHLMAREGEASTLRALEPEAIGAGYRDLEESRQEVLKIVFDAPRNRIDNEISRLSLSARSLQLHCQVLHSLAHGYLARRWASAMRLFGAGVVSAGVSAALAMLLRSGDGLGLGLGHPATPGKASTVSVSPSPGPKKASSSPAPQQWTYSAVLSPLLSAVWTGLARLSALQSALVCGAVTGTCVSAAYAMIRSVQLAGFRRRLVTDGHIAATVRDLQAQLG